MQDGINEAATEKQGLHTNRAQVEDRTVERVESTTLRSWAGIGLIAATGLVHLVETPEYFGEMPYIGVLFALSVVGALIAAFGR